MLRILTLLFLIFTAQTGNETFTGEGDPTFTFDHPTGWTVTQDSTLTYFVSAGDEEDVTVLIELFAVEDDPAVQSGAEAIATPAELLAYYFPADADDIDTVEVAPEVEATPEAASESTPEATPDPTTAPRVLLAARLAFPDEDVYAFYLDAAYYALLFVNGDDRAANADAIFMIAATLGQVERDNRFAAGEVATQTGSLTFDYPASLELASIDGATVLFNADSTVSIIIAGDPVAALNLFGGEGDASELNSAETLMNAVLFTDRTGEDDVEAYEIAGRDILRFDVSDSVSDLAFITVEVPGGPPVMTLFSLEAGTIAQYEENIEGILSSLRFEP